VDLTSAISEQSSMKRKADTTKMASELAAKRSKEGSSAAGALTLEVANTTYWESPEAKKLFLGPTRRMRETLWGSLSKELSISSRPIGHQMDGVRL